VSTRNNPYPLGGRAFSFTLAAGNTVILKGSENAPKSFLIWGELFQKAGLPPGCLNIIYHRPQDAGSVTAHLEAHPAVRKINFAGSTMVGSIIAKTAG
jgi:acyl-CoA reductase-like NAD-dependent aldehyde dehydrogenase